MTLSRRQFLRRGALLAAGTLAVPGWAQWLGEKMEALRPKPRVFMPAARMQEEIHFPGGVVTRGRFASGFTNVQSPPRNGDPKRWRIVGGVHDKAAAQEAIDSIGAEMMAEFENQPDEIKQILGRAVRNSQAAYDTWDATSPPYAFADALATLAGHRF